MTDHEMVLLRAAVEAGAIVSGLEGEAPTTANLTALLTDLGADVPEWPSGERVTSILSQPRSLDYLWHLTLPEYLALRPRGES